MQELRKEGTQSTQFSKFFDENLTYFLKEAPLCNPELPWTHVSNNAYLQLFPSQSVVTYPM